MSPKKMHDNRLNTMVHFAAHLLAISAGVVAGGITNRFLGTSTQLGLVLVILLFVLWVSKKIETTTTLDKNSKKKKSKKVPFVAIMAGVFLGKWINDRFGGTNIAYVIFGVLVIVSFVLGAIEKIVAFIQKRRQP